MPTKTLIPLLGLTLLLGACGQPSPPPYGSPNLTASALTPCPACTWQDLGPQPLDVSPDHFSEGTSLTLAGGQALVAWSDLAGPQIQVFVREALGAGWSAPVLLNAEGGEAVTPSLAADGTGSVAVAFTQASGGRTVIRVKRRVVQGGASSWVPLDPLSDQGLSANGRAFLPHLALHPDGTPYLAWTEQVGGQLKVYVRRYRGGTWQNLGANADGSLDFGNNPKVAINRNGLFVAYTQNSPDGPRVAVRRWNGSALQAVASPSTVGGAGGFSLAVDPLGAAVVAVTEFRNGHHDVLVKRRSGGGSWVTLGGPLDLNPAAEANQPSLIVTPDQTAVVWAEGGALVMKRWDAAAGRWTLVGERINPPGRARRPTLAAAPDGVPTVAFDQGDGQLTDIRVRRFGP
ncbi:hypothetical protein [Deinococcus planocerae]|uniref:hypothetical protein n=1 Tax=Deinococcus planocerae TaxID=1737569 RepID=UPI000C7EDAF2|nr:hypothetical protein [Deinococcus planocerae]